MFISNYTNIFLTCVHEVWLAVAFAQYIKDKCQVKNLGYQQFNLLLERVLYQRLHGVLSSAFLRLQNA